MCRPWSCPPYDERRGLSRREPGLRGPQSRLILDLLQPIAARYPPQRWTLWWIHQLLVVELAFYVGFPANSTYKSPGSASDPPKNSTYNNGTRFRSHGPLQPVPGSV